MQEWQRKRIEKISDLVMGSHLLAYLLTVSIFIIRLPGSYTYTSFNIILLGFFIPATLFITLDYYLLNSFRSTGQKNRLLLWNIAKHTTLFLLITYALIFAQQGLQLQGALYLLPVVLAAITFGRPGGLVAAAAASLSLFLLTWNKAEVYAGTVQESTFLLSSVFLLVAWFLGGVIEIENSTSHQLANMANEDELTGLGNHRLFQERLKYLVNTAKRSNQPLSLILLDIDNFKQYNDNYGHMQGDLILKELAGLLVENIPDGAEIARYGGDKFSIILPGFTLEKAVQVADLLREVVVRHRFAAEVIQPYEGLTISAGVANLPAHASSRDELLNAVDEALYSCKVTGSNRVKVYLGVLDKIRQAVEEDDREIINSLRTLMMLVNAKDRYTYGHSERVAFYIKEFAAYLGMDEDYSRLLEIGSFLHDIGKLETPREILNKKGTLDDDDWAVMREHASWGAEILQPIKFLKPVIPMVLHHHENYDGSGCPLGLAGEEIPFAARMLRIVDSFDAMRTVRPYHKPMPLEKIFFELESGGGRFYDPQLVRVFIALMREKTAEAERSAAFLNVLK